MKTHAFDFGSYDTWVDEGAAETTETLYTMPPPRCDIAGDVLGSTSTEPFNAMRGSVTVYVLRGHVTNFPRIPWRFLVERDRDTKERPLTDPPIRRMGKIQNSPITIAKSWFDKLGGRNGRPYVFGYINFGAEDIDRNGWQMRVYDPTPDDEMANTKHESPHGYDTEDCFSLYGSGEGDGNSSVTSSDTSTVGSAWDKIDADLDLATRFPHPAPTTRKRKRRSNNVPKRHPQPQRGGTQSSTLVQAKYSKAYEADEDDEELLPAKTESPHSATALNIAVTALGASQASQQDQSKGTAPKRRTGSEQAAEEYEEEDLYGDSRHPSLYNESAAVERRNHTGPDNAESNVSQRHGPLDQDEQSDTGSSRCKRTTLLRQGQPPTPIDLTTDEGEDLTQVKQEVAEPHGSKERNSALATTEDVASDDEGDLKILAEEIRLKREDVRLQMEELKLRKKLRALEKKRASTRR
ncbi:hypothetical protein LTR15_000151 [Elasticomyces elasticus]|nr:hypothetical protein LTR15_000151 [Elasticomyces elasticus]